MTNMKKKICLQVVSADEPFDSFVGMFLIEELGGMCVLTRDPDKALSFDTVEDALDTMYSAIYSPFIYSPVIILEGGDE